MGRRRLPALIWTCRARKRILVVSGGGGMDLQALGQNRVFTGADVAVAREQARQRRLARMTIVLGLLCLWLWLRLVQGRALIPVPHLSPQMQQVAPLLLLVVILGFAMFIPLLGAGRSPHVLFRANEIDT